MSSLQVIELFAGHDPAGQPIVEKLQVETNDKAQAKLLASPAFVKGLARGDLIRFNSETQQCEIIQHSGNLCVRVISKADINQLQETLTAEMEKLGGQLDIATPRLLVYSIHVSCGFKAIEELLNRHVTLPDSIWLYGNVYDPQDGETPLNWWLDILQPE